MSEASDEAKKPEEEQAEPTPEGAGEVLPSAAPAKKKKKKKRKASGATADTEAELAPGASDAEPELDVSGAERPAFLRSFPADPELDLVVRAFEVGNYALVRQRGGELAQRSQDERVRAAARELLARIEPDPLMKYLLLAAVALLLFIVFYAYRAHSH